MGKYSLDAFEAHPLVKLRPPMGAPGHTSFTLISSPAEARGTARLCCDRNSPAVRMQPARRLRKWPAFTPATLGRTL